MFLLHINVSLLLSTSPPLAKNKQKYNQKCVQGQAALHGVVETEARLEAPTVGRQTLLLGEAGTFLGKTVGFVGGQHQRQVPRLLPFVSRGRAPSTTRSLSAPLLTTVVDCGVCSSSRGSQLGVIFGPRHTDI